MNVGMRPGIRTMVFATLLVALVSSLPAVAQEGVAGKWRTEARGPQGSVVVILQLEQDMTGRWIGTAKSSVKPDEVQELEAVQVDGNRVRFRRQETAPGLDAPITAEFDLRLRPLENKLRGSVLVKTPMGDREQPVEFTRVVERADAEGIQYQSDRPVVGAWSARPDDDDDEREIKLDVLPDGDSYRGTITDTGIGATVALRDLEVKDGSVVSFNFRFEGAPFMSSFWGRYDEVRDEMRGTMSVGGRSQPLRFERTSQGPDDVVDEFGTEREPLPIKHDSSFAATLRVSLWQPLYVLKEKQRNINDITSAKMAFDGGIRYHLIDYLAVQLRYATGGLGFDTNEKNLALFDPVTGPQGNGLSAPLTTDAEISMSGLEFSLVGYLGQSLFPESKFNPYLTLLMGRTTWELTDGSNVLEIFEEPVEGTDWTFGGGLGTEYAINSSFGIEAEWLWAYTTTEDDTKWEDTTLQWTSQHVFRFSLGAILWF